MRKNTKKCGVNDCINSGYLSVITILSGATICFRFGRVVGSSILHILYQITSKKGCTEQQDLLISREKELLE